jgi:FkbM family methyltransferase
VANKTLPDDLQSFREGLQSRSEALQTFEEEIRRQPAKLEAFEEELRSRPADLELIARAVQADRSDTSGYVEGDLACPTPAEDRIIPSSLGTDVSRFQATTRRNQYEDQQMRLVLATALGPESNAVDVGAHGGTVLREVQRLAPRGQHLAYEPLPDQARKLAQLFPEVDVRQSALADREGRTTFVHVTTLSPWSGLQRRPYPDYVKEEDLEEIPVTVERLDSSLPEGYVPTVIKVDVEGAEEMVLRGALGTLVAHRPLVIFEHSISASWGYGTTSASLYRLLCDEAGYRIFDLAGDGPYTAPEFEESQRQLRWVNYIARP